MHDNDLTPEEQKVKDAKDFLKDLKEIDPEEHDRLLQDRFHEQLDKVIDELYGNKRDEYISILHTDVADMDYRQLKKLQGLVSLFLVSMSLGRLRKRPKTLDPLTEEEAEQEDEIYGWVRDIIEGPGGMNDYEFREGVVWDKPIKIEAAEWAIRCLANVRSAGSEAVFQRIAKVRSFGHQALKQQLDRQEALTKQELEITNAEETTDDSGD